MSYGSLAINFANVSTAEGNLVSSTLAEALRDVGLGIVVEPQRERSDTEDCSQ